VYITVHNELF